MFAPTRYLEWARRFYGQVPFDLASSGMTNVSLAEIGASGVDLDDVRGWSRLGEAIARYNDVPSNEAIAALGTTQAIWLAYVATTSIADEVLIESPGYEPLIRVAEGLGLRVRRFERDAADGYALDPDRVKRAMSAATRVVVVTNLHNPTGVRASDEAMRAIAAMLAARGGYLVVDEVYAPFDALAGDDGAFRASARKLAPNVVAISSLTKCYGLGNHRFGWMLAAPEVIARAEHATTASSGMLPLAHANLGVAAFVRVPALAKRARALLDGKRARVERWLAGRADLEWSLPRAGLFGLARVRDSSEDLTARIERGVVSHGVLVAAGAFFDVPSGFRLSWSIASEKLDEALERLGRMLDAR